jgi:porin
VITTTKYKFNAELLSLSIKYMAPAFAFMLSLPTAEAHELTEKLSLDGILSGAIQCLNVSDDTIVDDTCKGALPFQPAFTYRTSQHDRIFLSFGFATGNGLNEVSPFNVSTWGADLEDDVININGSGRDHILELWYEHVVEFEPRNRLGMTFGILDASRYLDQNRYANDEYIQFMNPALSNAPNLFFPSYDLGVAIEWLIDTWSFTGVFMDVNQETTTDNYTFYGLQLGYLLNSSLGNGNYRVMFNGNNNYVDPSQLGKQNNDTLIISIDQQLGKQVGIFTRLGWRLDEEAINYRAIYSGGIDIRGTAWGRLLDNIGIGIVYLEGGNSRIISTRIAEGYYRLVLNPYLAITADIQYMQDRLDNLPETEGFIYSIRATLNF